MAVLTIDPAALVIELGRWERLMTFRFGARGRIRIPWADVVSVEVVPRPVEEIRGLLRTPGQGYPLPRRVGIFTGGGRKVLAAFAVRRPALRLQLRHQPWDTAVVEVPDPERCAASVAGKLPQDRPEAGRWRLPDGVALAGTRTRPAGGAPVAVALLLPGSGPIDRDSNLPRSRLGITAELANALAANGIAGVRYDKRGVGASGGSFLPTGLRQLVADARTVADALHAEQPELPLFLVGHSEGALIAAALAGADQPPPGLAGVVLLSGFAGTGEEALRYQGAQLDKSLPAPVRGLLRVLRVDLEAKQRKSFDKLRATTGDVARVAGKKLNARWWRELLDVDAAPLLRRISVPVLAITGDKDLQVNPDDLDRIAELVPAEVEISRIPNLTHLLRKDAAPASLRRYRRQLRHGVDRQVLSEVSEWIIEHV